MTAFVFLVPYFLVGGLITVIALALLRIFLSAKALEAQPSPLLELVELERLGDDWDHRAFIVDPSPSADWVSRGSNARCSNTGHKSLGGDSL